MRHFPDTFSPSAVTTYPLGIQAVAITSMILAGMYMDRTKRYMDVGVVTGILQFMTGAMLVAPTLPDAGTFFAFYVSGSSFMVNPLLYGWGGVIVRRTDDDAARAIILFTMNTGGQLLWTFWGITLYPAVDVPYWKKGSIVLMIACIFYFGALCLVRWVSAPRVCKTKSVTDCILSA